MSESQSDLDFDNVDDESSCQEASPPRQSNIPPPLSSHGYSVLRATTLVRLDTALKLAGELSDEIFRIESGPFGRCDCVDVENLIDGIEKAKFSLAQLRKR